MLIVARRSGKIKGWKIILPLFEKSTVKFSKIFAKILFILHKHK